MANKLLVVGIGGTTRAGSSTEKALRFALKAAVEAGAETELMGPADLQLPMYAPEFPDRTPQALRLVELLRRADGIIVGSPGYHGGISGLVKNALDYVEDMRGDARVYFDGRAVGCVVTAAGYQAAVGTLGALRQVVHALRGWPTPVGVAINTAEPAFDAAGQPVQKSVADQLTLMAHQVVAFAEAWKGKLPPLT
jgi:FMN reductase